MACESSTLQQYMAIAVAIVIVLCVLIGSHFLRAVNPIETTRQGATDFLTHTAEWAKWMAGIQTAALGVLALAVLDKDYLYGRCLTSAQSVLAVSAFVLLGCALLTSAWVLSSIPSQAIRLHAVRAKDTERNSAFDIYEQPLYGWLVEPADRSEKRKLWRETKVFTFGYLLTVQHSFWGIGLLCLAGIAATIFITPPPAKAACDLALPTKCAAPPNQSQV